MWFGWIEFDLLLGDVHSLKAKRTVVRPILTEIRHRFKVPSRRVETRTFTAAPGWRRDSSRRTPDT